MLSPAAWLSFVGYLTTIYYHYYYDDDDDVASDVISLQLRFFFLAWFICKLPIHGIKEAPRKNNDVETNNKKIIGIPIRNLLHNSVCV